MILEPEQESVDPSSVRSFTPEVEVEDGAGNTEMEAPESTKKRSGRQFVPKINQRTSCRTGR